MNYNFQIPVNSVSFGHVGFNILREFYNRGKLVKLFNIQEPPDFSSFDIDLDFHYYLSSCSSQSRKSYNINDPGFRLWHIFQSESVISKSNQTLFTFYELDSPTPHELNVLKNQDNVLVSNSYTKQVLEDNGLTNVKLAPLGFDNHHFKPNYSQKHPDKISFSLFGKFEVHRKNTPKVIQAWVKKFGNDPRYVLNLSVFNVHLNPEQNNQLLVQTLNGVKPYNVNVLPYYKTLKELSNACSHTDIVLDMGTEGWSLPSFHAVGMGSYGVLLNCAGIKEWAQDTNSVLIEPNGKKPVYDNMFFRQGAELNQGNVFDFDEEQFIAGCEEAIRRVQAKRINDKGLELQNRFTWSKTVDVIEGCLNN